MIDGITITIGNKPYILPNLNFRGLQRVADYLPALAEKAEYPTAEQLEGLLKIATESLKRNYPEITEDYLADQIENYEIPALMAAICEQFAKKKGMKETAETTVIAPPIGDIFTPNLLPLPDGAGITSTNI